MQTHARQARLPFRYHWLVPGLALLLASGCTTMATSTVQAPEQTAALALLESGQAGQAAQQLETLAATATGQQRNALLADAAFAWHEAGDAARARAVAAQFDPRRLGGASRARLSLMQAEQAIAAQQPGSVQATLVGDPATLPVWLQARWQLASAAGLEAGGDAIGAAAARARADTSLHAQQREDNRRAIERLLSSVDDATLSARAAALPAGDPLYNFAGRALARRGLPLPRAFDRGEGWNFDAAGRPPAASDGYRPPVKLAVLLPLSGQLATAAGPVRDGLLAGYYGERRTRPQISFYDTAGTPAGAVAAYAKAVSEGNDFVVGPLGRDEVGAVFREASASVPSLALNRAAATPPPGHLMFSLAPEDDGIAAAEYLIAREHRNVLLIGSNDDNGQRAVQAFRERLAERGGRVAGSINVGEQPGDLSAQLVAASAAGADAVFLAVRGPQARALVPQLALAGLAGRTRVASSQLTSGTGKADEDLVLDGIVFPTEAWPARSVAGLPSGGQAAEMVPTARGAAARLFAFGYDAWRITGYLEQLATRADGKLDGATGTLRLDGFGNILRSPAWATFSGGAPVPLRDGG